MEDVETEVPAASEPAIASLRASLSRERRWFVVAGVLLGMLLSSLDQTVVGTAMPRIIAELNGLNHYSWVFTAYMLASTVSIPIYGKLSDLYGRRVFFAGGMVIFLIGSALCGQAQDMTQLILFRGLQGLGAGAMMPIAIAIVGDIFPPAERGKWQGLMMAVFGLSSIVGPWLGGWLTDHWGWRWVFYVNMPVGVLAIITAGLALPGRVRRVEHRIDVLGAITLVAGTVPLLLGFSWAGTEYPWSSWQVLSCFAAALVMLSLALFVVEPRAPEPIISPGLFRNRVFALSVLASFLLSAGMFGAIMYIPLFLQAVVGISATNSGTLLMPMMLGFMTSSIAFGQILARTGRYKIPALAGIAIAVFGNLLLWQMPPTATAGIVIRNMVIVGLGLGGLMSLFTIVVQNAFPLSKLGEVTANLQFFRSIGGTIGVAILGTVMTNRFNHELTARLPAQLAELLSPDRLEQLRNPQALQAPDAAAQLQQAFAALGPQGVDLFNKFMLALRDSLATSITSLFAISALALALSFVTMLFMPEIPLRGNVRRAAPEQPPTTGTAGAIAAPLRTQHRR
ncbi:MFS transporter [Thermomicrobiaceae bacterium CFH 74404]|uniref:MFS transporter n=1 Tax=Thermalbibacter longus TaxID=2951981 RepID=A0AA42BB04_9BACT|nr:MDR family MFS transporter [Thermalbibacter longus]MCM8750347.1 MFS transporter [Thermalbibacter longus]